MTRSAANPRRLQGRVFWSNEKHSIRLGSLTRHFTTPLRILIYATAYAVRGGKSSILRKRTSRIMDRRHFAGLINSNGFESSTSRRCIFCRNTGALSIISAVEFCSLRSFWFGLRWLSFGEPGSGRKISRKQGDQRRLLSVWHDGLLWNASR